MACNCRGGSTCCMNQIIRESNLCYGFGYHDDTDVYFQSKPDISKARDALQKARAKRKKNLKYG